MTAQDIVRTLGGKWRGTSGTCRCPAHDDHTPSLDVTERDGKILVKCRANCSQFAVLDALRKRELWPEPRANAHKAGAPHAGSGDWVPILPVPAGTPAPDFATLLRTEPTAFWDYQDSRGNLLGYTARVENKSGKAIIPITWCSGPNGATAWRCKGFPEPRPLYGLPQLAEQPNAPVIIVEGEKVAVATQNLLDGHVAVTWPGGTGAVRKADWQRLKGRAVVIWPDADAPGAKAAREVADQAIRAGAASVRIVTLPAGLPNGWDLADDIPDGLDPYDLVQHASALEPGDHEAPDQGKEAGKEFLGLLPALAAGDVARWQGREPEPLVFTVDELVPEGMVTLLVSEGGAGKSILMQTACACIAGGLPFLRRETATGKCAGIFAEDPEAVLHHRQGRINDTLDLDIEALAGRCFIQSYSGHDATLWNDGAPTPFMERLQGELSRIDGLRFVALDNAALIYSGNENDRCEVTSFINRLNGMAEQLGVGIVLTTHVSKSTDGSTLRVASGSTAWLNASRAVLELKPEKDDQPPVLRVRKSNHTRPGLEIALEWRDGVLMPAAELDSFQASARDHAIERLILERVAKAWNEKTPLSDTPQASARYLPKVLCRSSNFQIKELKKHMEALQDGGFIKMDLMNSRTPRGFRVVRYPDRPEYRALKDAPRQGNGDVEVAS